MEVGQGEFGLGLLGSADEESQASCGGYEAGGCGEDRFETFDCAKGYYVEGGGDGFGAGGLYIDVGQCKSPRDLAQEGGFFVARFD